jgi:hypothetical protein
MSKLHLALAVYAQKQPAWQSVLQRQQLKWLFAAQVQYIVVLWGNSEFRKAAAHVKSVGLKWEQQLRPRRLQSALKEC